MKTFVFLIGVLTLSMKVQCAIIAAQDDFVVDCGTDALGMVSITYTSSTPSNSVVSMSSPKGRSSCSTSTVTAAGQMVILDARTNCDITRPDPNKPEFWLQITLQEVKGVYLQIDPTYLFKCSYSVGEVPVSSVVVDAGNVGVPNVVEVSSTGRPDMTYSLSLVNPIDPTVKLTEARFGDMVVLQVAMNDTDDDEQGVKVKSCVVKSGTISLPIIEDFCVVPGKEPLFLLDRFISNGVAASFPMTVFALEGSQESSVQFRCVAEVCPSACSGINCPAKRKRRASGTAPTPTEDKVVTMVTRLQIVPESGATSGQSGTVDTSTRTGACLQSLGFIVTVGVLAVLLLVAIAVVFFMFNTRRRELQKQGA